MAKVFELLVVVLLVCVFSFTTSHAAAVNETHKRCILDAISAGSRAHGNVAALKRTYNQYFAGERMAALAARSDWKKFDAGQKKKWADATRSFVINQIVPRIVKYANTLPTFLRAIDRGGTVEVVGVVGGNTITWRILKGQCRFVDVSVEGVGRISDFVRSGMHSKERRSSR